MSVAFQMLMWQARGSKWVSQQSFFHCQASQARLGVGWLGVIPQGAEKGRKGEPVPTSDSKALGGHEATHHMHG